MQPVLDNLNKPYIDCAWKVSKKNMTVAENAVQKEVREKTFFILFHNVSNNIYFKCIR